MAIELGCPYYVYNLALTKKFALNVPADADYVGLVNDVTGLDDAGVRENAQVIAAGDGGYHGRFFRDRRPWTIVGSVMPVMPITSRSASQDKMADLMNQAIEQDGILTWLPSDGIQRMIHFRKQQPFRSAVGQSNVNRQFTLAGVSADYRILSTTINNLSTLGNPVPLVGFNIATPAVNNGNALAAPIFTITPTPGGGAVNGIDIVNQNTGKRYINGATIPDHGSTFMVVNLNQTYPAAVIYDGGVNTDVTGYTDLVNSDWSIGVEPASVVGGSGQLFGIGSGGGSVSVTFGVQWYDSYI